MERGKAEALRRAVRLSSLIVLPFGLFWVATGLALGAASFAGLGCVVVVMCAWLLLEASHLAQRSESTIANH